MLGEYNVLVSSKHAIAQHHLQLNGETLGHLKESGCILVGRRGTRLGTHRLQPITEEDHQGKEVTDEGISNSREFPQLLTSGDRITVK